MKVVVVGAGVVGLCTALALHREGAEVVVVDRSAGPGASAGNAGWVVPVLSHPLSGPGVLAAAVRATLRGEGSVGVHPEPGLLRWLAGFLRAGTPARYRSGLRETLGLGARSVELYAQLRDSGVEFELHRRGLVLAARTARGAADAEELVAAARGAGYTGDVVIHRGSAVRTLEPALSPDVVAAVHAPEEAHVRPETLLAGLRTALAAGGVALRDGVDVRGAERGPDGWTVAASSGPPAACRPASTATTSGAR